MNNKSKVVLFFPKLEPYKPFHWFPISLLAIAAPVIAKEFKVVIIDERIDKRWKARIKKECKGALCLGMTAYTGYQLIGALNASKIIKKKFPDLPIIWGGPHVTNLPLESIKNPLVDIIVLGYGENSFTEIISRLVNKNNLNGIDGIYFKIGSKIFKSPNIFAKINLNEFSRIPYELIDIDKYINPKRRAFIYISSYGCPGICSFCSTQFTRRFINLNFNKVIKDINFVLDKYNFKNLVLFDATFFINENRVIALANFFKKKEKLEGWICDGRALDLLRLKDSTFEILVKSKIKEIVIGLESGSQKIINIMKKGDDHLAIFKKVLKRLSNYKIDVVSGVVFGIPGETLDDLKLTLEYIKKIELINPRFRVSTTFFSPLPGTELYNYINRNFDFKFPKTLEGWAKLGKKNHYVYNQFVDTPYIPANIKGDYFKIYDNFWKKNNYLRI